MKKVIRIEHLDCANCAAKLERALSQIPGVEEVSVSFLTQKIILKGADEGFDQVVEQVITTIQRTEPDVSILN